MSILNPFLANVRRYAEAWLQKKLGALIARLVHIEISTEMVIKEVVTREVSVKRSLSWKNPAD
jgi:hypothetical protein